jgi:hypothetical protein
MPPRQRRKKPLDKARTVQRYVERIAAAADADPDFLSALEGKFLTAYDIFSTVEDTDGISQDMKTQVHAVALMELARSRGVAVRGVTSERKKGGEYACAARKTEPCVYVGKYSYWGTRETSKYALTRCDYVHTA